MIFVSTGGFSEATASETAKHFLDIGIKNIELSGGVYSSSLFDDLKLIKDKTNLRIHNYFPPAAVPFALNLASLTESVSKQSMDHCKKAMIWSEELGSRIYSFHPGSLVDLNVKELGNKIKKRKLFDRDMCLERFVHNVKDLAHFAEEKNMELLIENNVLSYDNLKEFGEDFLLITTPAEARLIMENTPENVKLLIDVAHLKISAHSLGFKPERMFEECNQWITAYHLSDNDGLNDRNEIIRENSWFWPLIKRNLDYYSIEVYNENYNILKNQLNLVREKLE